MLKSIALVSVALAGIITANSANATVVPKGSDYTFEFTGTCSDCSGTVDATLMVKNYVLGTQLNSSEFVSFTYDGSNLLKSYTIDKLALISGSIGSTPGEYNLNIAGLIKSADPIVTFTANSNGNWSTGPLGVSADRGTNFSIAAVPEPATWMMMLLGFGMVGLATRKRIYARTTLAVA